MVIEKALKIALVGNSKVGKTSLLIRYSNDTFLDPNFVMYPNDGVKQWYPTSSLIRANTDFKNFRYEGVSTDIKDGNVIYRVHLADIPGKDDSAQMRSFQYSQTGVFILCFALNDPDSYANIQKKWIPELKPFMGNTPLVLAGTKSDLKTEGSISVRQAKRLRKECNASSYVECSAKDGSGVNAVIKAALTAHINSSKPRKKLRCVVL